MVFGESRLKDLYRRAVWGPGRALLEASPDTAELRLIRAAARAAAVGLSKRRAHITANLARAFPDHDGLDAIAREAFAAHFSNQYLSFTFGKCTASSWPRYLRFEGLSHLETAHAAGKGVVLMHPHMGPAQLPLHVLGLTGWPMHQVGGGEVTLVELSETGRWAAETRARLERRMPVTLHDGKGFLRPVLRALRAGNVVMSACDATGGGTELGRRSIRTVLGQPFPLPVGPVWMAYMSGAPLLTVHCYRSRRPGAMFTAEIGPPLPIDREDGRAAALSSGTDHTAAFLDRVLRAHPGDWLFWDGFEPGGLLPEAS
jgi:lauroyl/myristoyl acyltransferase